MTNKEKKYYNKLFLPKYMKVFNIAAPIVILGILIAFFAAIIFSVAVAPELNLAGKITIVFLVALVIAAIVLISLVAAFNKKLVAQRKAELEKEYSFMPFEKAQEALISRGVISEKGFMVPHLAGGEVVPVLPFDDAVVHLFSANVCSKVLTVATICNKQGGIMAEYMLDKELYNYLQNGKFGFRHYGGSELLFGDKGAFVKKVIKTRNRKGAALGFVGAVGFLLAEHERDNTPEMQAVLRVLRKENINVG